MRSTKRPVGRHLGEARPPLPLVPVLVLAGFALAACRVPNGGADGGAACRSNAECEDSIDCTVDTCGVSGECEHTAVDALCPAGQRCVVGIGCRDEGCTSADECDDSIDCTIDNCAVGGECSHTPVDGLCGSGERCVEGVGCEIAGCTSAAECDDGIECTIDDCDVTNECVHSPVDGACGEGERCFEGHGCLGQCESPEDCDDGDFCNGAERCQTEFGCLPAEAPRDCDDNDECTVDACDSGLNRCVYEVSSAVPGCDTFELGDLSGCFDLVPELSQRCAVVYAFSRVCFEMVGPVLTITPTGYEGFELTQNPGPTDEHFRAELEVTGGCTERYALTGTFSGSNTWSGTWTSQFVNVDGISCALGGCRNLTIPVTATRAP